MKKITSLPRTILLLIIGVGVALMSAAVKTVVTIAQSSVPTPTPSAVATVVDSLEVGSTDGILVLAFIISLVIILPISISWRVWAKKTTEK
ncbi:MAG: hypothetical protein HN855_01785 [Anaerolineae bacterium]|jgi:hypothetical protein|nr:hypothetical protein [Anaerolineae bacterium]MBT7069898.1 hypothetical protein [Anaerolineae bacterium]MBT7323871.1 hypothetical protein [Anaerolineae bacterium]